MTQILLPINPKYANNILLGTKKYEYRKNKCKDTVDKIILYATAPVKKIIGSVEVIDILEDNITTLWEKTKTESGITKEEFDKYFKGKDTAVAYKLGTTKTYQPQKNLIDFGIKFTPQSFIYINKR